MYAYDTNALLELQESAFDDDFIISQQTLTEIENIKTNRNKDDDIKRRARNVARLLFENFGNYRVIPYDKTVGYTLNAFNLPETPDNIICASVFSYLNDDDYFVTDDLNCATIMNSVFQKNTVRVKRTENIYKGYKQISGTSDEINSVMNDENYISSFCTNEYLLINNTELNKESEMRFDGEKFVPLKLPPSRCIKAKNSLQRCALDILNNPEITVAAILGGFGSGKSFLTMRMAVYAVREKGWQSSILGVRSPWGEGKEIGFLPGDVDEKTGFFFLPLIQQLDGGEFEFEALKNSGMLSSTIPYYMKGTTFNHTVMMVDEAEDLTAKELRLVGTRIGEGSRIFLNGDYKQSVVNANENNALLLMCNQFKGNKSFGCIYLGEDVRSETSKLFAGLFN